MQRMVVVALTLAILSVPGVMAQDQKVEFSLRLGYTLSEGVDIDNQPVPGTNQEVRRVSPKNGASWGLQFDYLATENISFGFLFDQQFSKLVLTTQDISPAPSNVVVLSPGDKEVADMKNYNYHGVLTFNLGESDSTVRPFVFLGLGATRYNPGSLAQVPVPAAGTGSINSATKFSTTWGGGVKAYISPNVSVQFGGRWTPTSISSEATGWLCDPFWGCHVLVNSELSHQFEMTGGLSFRF